MSLCVVNTSIGDQEPQKVLDDTLVLDFVCTHFGALDLGTVSRWVNEAVALYKWDSRQRNSVLRPGSWLFSCGL